MSKNTKGGFGFGAAPAAGGGFNFGAAAGAPAAGGFGFGAAGAAPAGMYELCYYRLC